MISRTYDTEYIKGIVTDPVNYDYLVDDGSPSQKDYEPVMNEGVYYLDLDGKGVAMFFRTNHIAFDMHVCMKEDCRGKVAYQLGRDAVKWIQENTCCLKINARIPVFNNKVLNYEGIIMPFLAPFVPALIGGAASLIGARGAKKQAKRAANDSRRGTELTAQAQRDALEYTQQTEAPLLDARNQGLAGLTGLYGEGGDAYQQQLIDRAQNSPLYSQIMGNRQFGEDAILRNASATGGLRSGNVQYNMNDYNTRLSNDALLQSYNQQVQGLEGLSNVGTNTGSIAKLIADIGQTQGQGAIAQGQIAQQGSQNSFNNILGGVNLGLDAYNSGVFSGGGGNFGSAGNSTDGYNVGGYRDAAGGLGFSDIRLKSNPECIGSCNGHQIYSWTWNKEAEKLGLSGKAEGVMAHEVMEYDPEAIGEHDGFITVDYAKLGLI